MVIKMANYGKDLILLADAATRDISKATTDKEKQDAYNYNNQMVQEIIQCTEKLSDFVSAKTDFMSTELLIKATNGKLAPNVMAQARKNRTDKLARTSENAKQACYELNKIAADAKCQPFVPEDVIKDSAKFNKFINDYSREMIDRFDDTGIDCTDNKSIMVSAQRCYRATKEAAMRLVAGHDRYTDPKHLGTLRNNSDDNKRVNDLAGELGIKPTSKILSDPNDEFSV